MKNVIIQIDGKKIKCEENQSVLEVAIENKIDIPHFCYHEDLPTDANCRTCLVENEDSKEVVTSCTLKVSEGLKVKTNSKEVKRLRNENLKLLLADHEKNCKNCSRGHFCKTRETIEKYKIKKNPYNKAVIDESIHKMGSAAEYDPQVCINCNKCVEVCKQTGIGFLKLEGKGALSHITYNKNPNCDCIYCGQCTVHCPVGAIREQSHIKEVEHALKDKNKIVIAQMAPSIRTSIGEEFGMEYGADLTGQMYTALRKLKFDKIFDVNMGADITTWVEAEELVHRIKNNGILPLFTSCCPGWVKFLEFYYPDMIPHLTTARSPQIHSGGAYKTWWAEKHGIDPKKIVVISIMPCTSKKYEAHHDKLRIDGLYPVDYVLTTRETAVLLKKNKINLPKLKPSSVDKYGEYSGAAAIYGATGGVMESALRSTAYFLAGKDIGKIEFKSVRGMEKIKRATVKIGEKELNVAVVTTAKYARIILEEIKRDPHKYDYIEFMACPGGCIGGGGQPIPSTERIIEKRIQGLYAIDDDMKIRRAHHNPIVKEFFEEYIEKLPKKRQEEILHTHYEKKEKFE